MRGIHIPEIWEMRLYVAGDTPASEKTIRNLQSVCDAYLAGRCHIEIIDIRKHPELAAKKEIFAIPTLVKELPLPVRRLIGDLHETDKVLLGLDLTRRKQED